MFLDFDLAWQGLAAAVFVWRTLRAQSLFDVARGAYSSTASVAVFEVLVRFWG